MDQHVEVPDLEAAPPLPEETRSECSFGNFAQPQVGNSPSSSTGRRKKILAAAVAIVAIAGIAIGVAVAAKPSNTPDQPGNLSQSNQDVVAVDSEPSDAEAVDVNVDESAGVVDELSYHSSGDEADNSESPAGVSNEEISSNGAAVLDYVSSGDEPADNESASEGLPRPSIINTPQAEDINYIYIDNEGVDLIFDEGYEHTEPEYDMIDTGTELGVHITTGEKIPLSAGDFEVVQDFKGPVTDFIVTQDISRIAVTTSSTCPNANDGQWKMSLQTDDYPWETYWELADEVSGGVIAKGPPKGRNYARSTRYIGLMCLKSGRYTMKMGDKNKDGNCCQYGAGKMTVWVNGKTAAETDDQIFEELNFPLLIEPHSGGVPSTPTPAPITNKPTPVPTREPIPAPEPNNFCADYTVGIKVETDRFGRETGYKFSRGNAVLVEKFKGDLASLTTYEETLCLEAGDYLLTMEDGFQGLQEDGSYSVSINGQEIMFGTTFRTKTVSHTIRVGYEPPMTDKERKWLEGHNSRRKAFHEENGETFRPLVWSPDLALEASEWADKIAPTCNVNLRQSGLEAGENKAARSSGNNIDEGPEVIMTRWAERKLGVGYPKNQSMTQMFWMSTRYVGCTSKKVEMEGGNMCYVSICRYSRSGNCAVGKFDSWKQGTLAPRTGCGPICPGNVCY